MAPQSRFIKCAASRQRPIVPRCQTESTRKPGSRSQKGRVTIFVRRYFSRLQRLACDLSCQPCGNTACDQHSQGEHCEDEGASSQRPVFRSAGSPGVRRKRGTHPRESLQKAGRGQEHLVGIHCCDNTRRPERTLVVDAKQAAKQKDDPGAKAKKRSWSVVWQTVVGCFSSHFNIGTRWRLVWV